MNVATIPLAELTITREIKAPRARVFAAWTDISQVSLWWAPRGFTLLECEIDLRPGGIWLRRMRGSDGRITVKHGVYREILPPERLVFTYNTQHPDGSIEPETVVTVTFADLGGRTQLTLHHCGFATEQAAIDHRGGWTSGLERFADFMAGR
jgi:uncharacterized protein YndB with AHSA1/START domain